MVFLAEREMVVVTYRLQARYNTLLFLWERQFVEAGVKCSLCSHNWFIHWNGMLPVKILPHQLLHVCILGLV